MEIIHNFDAINDTKEPSGQHSKCSSVLNLKVLLKQI